MQSLSPKICQQIATRGRRYRLLAIDTEKYLLTGEQSEALKERGLTVFDVIVGNYADSDVGFVDETKTDWNERMGCSAFKLEGWSD